MASAQNRRGDISSGKCCTSELMYRRCTVSCFTCRFIFVSVHGLLPRGSQADPYESLDGTISEEHDSSRWITGPFTVDRFKDFSLSSLWSGTNVPRFVSNPAPVSAIPLFISPNTPAFAKVSHNFGKCLEISESYDRGHEPETLPSFTSRYAELLYFCTILIGLGYMCRNGEKACSVHLESWTIVCDNNYPAPLAI